MQDNDNDKWQGDFFDPHLHHRYVVPVNADNHAEHRGRVGTCIGRRASGFGMYWALLKFDDTRADAPCHAWIRTMYLAPVGASKEVAEAVDSGA